MKANEFVLKYGWDAAKRLVENNKHTGRTLSPSELELKRLVESHELVEKLGGLERVKKAIDGKHIGYTHFYLHSNGRYVFLDHYVDFIPDHAQHIGMFNKVIADVESFDSYTPMMSR
ncbi:hypothetical protein [Acinetobacter terrae]|uniref:Uncharacterized protein n=1 Tax=Acinetobacter terrae TaxID=2731247 RepID=A0A4R0ER03_9GAMM|nr:hypothetical protein [Acinetobacter terrae]TCB62225.1 hypothetical protein E0H85_01505 [Acinetobacter terrae]